MRHAWNIAAALLVLATGLPEAVGQQLQLGRPGPPELGQYAFAMDLSDTLDREIDEILKQAETAEGVASEVLAARANARLIASSFLRLGHAAGVEGGASVLAGYTLAASRQAIDDSLTKLEVADADAVRALREFNSRVFDPSETLTASSLESVDQTLAVLLWPLAEAVALAEGARLADHWIDRNEAAIDDRAGASSGEPQSENTPGLDVLRERIVNSTLLLDSTKESLATVVDYLEAGMAFPEFRPRVARYQSAIVDALEAASTAEDVEWIGESSREQLATRLDEAAKRFRDKATHDEAIRRLRRLGAVGEVLARLKTVASFPRHRIDLRPFARALLSSVPDRSGEASVDERRLVRLREVVDRMIAFRELPPAELRGDLAVTERKLERAYTAAEEALIDRIGRIVSSPDALADPQLVSLLSNQKQYLDDVRRVRAAPEWIKQFRALDERLGEGLERQVRRLSAWLLDPARRQHAVLALGQLESQMNLFPQLPFEERLRSGDVTASAVTGDRQEELLRAVESRRREWAQAWATRGAGGEPANRMLLLFRLTQAMEDLSEVAALGGDAGALNAWAAWELETRSVAGAVSDAPNRLRLATQSAISDNDDELRRQLNRIDDKATLAKLIGRVARAIGPAVEDLPGGAVGSLGQLVHPPDRGDWMIRHRPEVANVCRYTLERAFARRTDRGDVADASAAYVDALAADLLHVLGEQREPIPSLIDPGGS